MFKVNIFLTETESVELESLSLIPKNTYCDLFFQSLNIGQKLEILELCVKYGFEYIEDKSGYYLSVPTENVIGLKKCE